MCKGYDVLPYPKYARVSDFFRGVFLKYASSTMVNRNVTAVSVFEDRACAVQVELGRQV